jgi:choline-sulfatase
MRRRLALLAALVATLACGRTPEPPLPVLLRLVDLLPGASFDGETDLIDFGEPTARRHLVAGWNDDEVDRRGGRSWLWSRGGFSTLQIALAAPRALRAEIRCMPHERFADGLTLEIVANGSVVSSLKLAPGARVYAADLPAAALRAGANELTFRYGAAEGLEHRHLRGRRAVAFDSIRLRARGEASGTATATAESTRPGAIRLPFHSSVAFVVDVPAGARLALGGLATEGGTSDLVVAVEGEDGGHEELRLRPGGSCCEPVALAGEQGRLVRLTLRADGPAEQTGQLWLQEPLVTAPVPRQAELPATSGGEQPKPQAAAEAVTAAATRPGVRPNIVVYLIDTLRADRLGVYGHTGGLTPNLDAFAREATVFDNATAQAPWTRPSVASIFTGLEPLDHGVWNLETKLGDGAVTVAERLADGGYRTAGFSTNHHVSNAFGLHQGFQDFRFFHLDPDSRTVNREVAGWLDQVDPTKPFFLYVHTIDPHEPYDPPADMRQRFAPDVPGGLIGDKPTVRRAATAKGDTRAELMGQLFALYDAEVAANDRSFGELVAELRRRDLYDDAWVFVLADHGEEFDEHGALGHTKNLHDETVDIPLMVKPPRQRQGSRVGEVVQHIDVLPTLLRAAGLEVPAGLRGRDLLLAAPGGARLPRAVFSHLASNHYGLSVRWGEWKLIRPLDQPNLPETLYRRRGAGDGGDREDVAARHPLRTEHLRSLLRLELARPHQQHADEAVMDDLTREGLEALGYL